jgi:O-antigen ligase
MKSILARMKPTTTKERSARRKSEGDGVLDALGAFLVAGLFLAVLPMELFLGTRVPFPFILYTLAVACFVLVARRRRLQDACLALFGRHQQKKATLLLLLGALVFWFGLQAFVSPCPIYAQRKYVLWLVNGVLLLATGYLWVDKPQRIEKILRFAMIWIALVLAFWLAHPNAVANLDTMHVILRGEFSQVTSCSFCRSVILAAMVCVVSLGLGAFKGPAALLPAGFVPVLLYLSLQSGSRGAVLSFAVAVSVFLITSLSRRRLLLLAAGMPVMAALLFAPATATNSVAGIIESGLLQGDVRDGSVGEHFAAWGLSIAAAIRHPLGIGFGGYPRLAGYGDEPLYPHNAVLEVWAESGLVGLVLFACLIVTPFLSLGRKQFTDKHIVAWESLFLVTFLFAMTYLGLEGTNPYWLFLGVLWSIRENRQSSPAAVRPRKDKSVTDFVPARGRRRFVETSASGALARAARHLPHRSDRPGKSCQHAC